MPDSSNNCGINCTRWFKSIMPQLPIIMLASRPHSKEVLLSLMSGACGYLARPVEFQEMIAAVSRALRGDSFICPAGLTALLHGLRRVGGLVTSSQLSWREEEILACVFLNLSNKEIADRLLIGAGTVHTYLARLFKKLDVHNRDEAIQEFLNAISDRKRPQPQMARRSPPPKPA